MQVDLNADLGEGFPYDLAIIPLIHSANISCGAHAGNEVDIQQALIACRQHQVKVGAHPSYPDRANFGRLVLNMPIDELKSSLTAQILQFKQWAAATGVSIHHLKMHGALYNQSADDEQLASMIAKLCLHLLPNSSLVTLPNSVQAQVATQFGIQVRTEVFADRAYLANGRLLNRQEPGAVLNADAAIAQVLQMLAHGEIRCVDGSSIAISADTICVHGDNEHAVFFLQHLHQRFAQLGMELKHSSSAHSNLQGVKP